MNRIFRLKNLIQPYAWGSRTAIADLLGEPCRSDQPQAELWMGAHPKAPSQIDVGGRWTPLDQVITGEPENFLGKSVAKKYEGRLPYLFKVLAAEAPLSIQAHPNRDQAKAGFLKENREKIPLDAPHRNYRDDNHKPEIICALSRFWALCGFRSADQIENSLGKYCGKTLGQMLAALPEKEENDKIRVVFGNIMGMADHRKKEAVSEAVESAQKKADHDDEGRWVLRLAKAYEGDIGVLAPLFLNLVCLEPDEALFLPAGQLHAYLEGTGIELMANSDNVLRGGLTPKHIDVKELMEILDFSPFGVKKITAVPLRPGESFYDAPADEFCLSKIRLTADGPDYQSAVERGGEIMLCTLGDGTICWGNQSMGFQKGDALLAPAAAGRYEIHGKTVLYKASVP